MELTKKAGADIIVDARKGHEQVVEEVKRVTNGEGVTLTINVSDAPKAMATSCAVTRMHGTVVQIAQVSSIVLRTVLLLSGRSRTRSLFRSRSSYSEISESAVLSSAHQKRPDKC